MKEKRKAGFTLVELMIVVAIIGILAAMAIPDFLRFQAKSRQSEAKMNLGAIWTCEKAYYGEYSTYAGGADAFENIGWSPMQQQRRVYSYIIDSSVMMGDFPVPSLPSGIPVTRDSFTVIAAGNIDRDAFVDVWGMNDRKVLKNMVPTGGTWGENGNDVGLE